MARKKKTEQPDTTDPDVAEFLADRSAEAQKLDLLTPEEYQRDRAERIWSFDDTGHQLTVEEQLFCRSYIIDRNPIGALRRLNYGQGPQQLKAIAARFLENPEVVACVEVLAQRMCEKLDITALRVNERIAAVAFFDPRSVVEFDHHGVRMKHSRFWTKDEAYAIAGIEMGQNGIKLKMHDGLRAAELLAKQLGLQPEEGIEAAALAMKAAAGTVMDTIVDIFRKTNPLPPPPALPAPEDAETKH